MESVNTTGQISGTAITTSSGAEVELKTCSKCKIEKPLTEFSKDKSKKDGHKYVCKLCENSRIKAYYEANREKLKAQKKAYYHTPRGRFFSHRKTAKKRGIEFLLTEEEAVELIKKPCTYCGKPGLSGIDRIDSNGVYTIENCEPCCGTCNNRKGTKSKEVFLEEIKEGKWDQ